MITAAKARGQDEEAVDSIWLPGKEEARRDFDRRNGMLLPMNEETGLHTTQHEIE